jgi:hypothetical protein
MLDNCEKIRCPDGSSATYSTNEEMINDFGILSIHISGTGRVRVLSYGREVFIMPPERIEKDERGPWLHVLAAIANDLVATFGMPGNTQRHLH